MTNKTLNGKVALVTGGSSGIGAACVRLFASEGARVIVGYNSGRDRAEQLISELAGVGHEAVQICLENIDEHEAIASKLQERYGSIHVLVNSAGRTQRVNHADLKTMGAGLYGDILLANARGTFSVTRALMPLLQNSKDGVVINVSSVSASTGSGSNLAYCAAASTPLGRVLSPEDVASAVYSCVAHLKTATGTTMVIDGGFTL